MFIDKTAELNKFMADSKIQFDHLMSRKGFTSLISDITNEETHIKPSKSSKRSIFSSISRKHNKKPNHKTNVKSINLEWSFKQIDTDDLEMNKEHEPKAEAKPVDSRTVYEK